jgi:hypothetical protein
VLQQDIPAYRIYALALGNAGTTQGAAEAHPEGARIEIKVLKNDLESLASTSSVSVPDK